MSRHLRSCVTCNRHIRIEEDLCPFCGAVVPGDRKSPPPRGNPAKRLGRAAALATVTSVGAAGAIIGSVACSDHPDEIVTGGDAYGVAPVGMDAKPDTVDAKPDVTATGGDAYGLAPPGVDAEPDVVETDAKPDVVVTGGDAYGVAPPVDAAPDVVVTGGDAYGVAPPVDGATD